jgi:hypothetical protein
MEDIKVNVADDTFVHFTYVDRAKEIVDQGVLLANPPHKKFVIVGVQAVSLKHGEFVPGVQTTHLTDKDQEIVAVVFKTRNVPKIGYPEEVIWDNDVELINPKIVSADKAKRILRPSDGSDYVIQYESLMEHLLN